MAREKQRSAGTWAKKFLKFLLAISTYKVEYGIHTNEVDINQRLHMKAFFLEILFVAEAVLFWSLALPAAAIFALFVLFRERLSALFPRESVPPPGATLSSASV